MQISQQCEMQDTISKQFTEDGSIALGSCREPRDVKSPCTLPTIYHFQVIFSAGALFRSYSEESFIAEVV